MYWPYFKLVKGRLVDIQTGQEGNKNWPSFKSEEEAESFLEKHDIRGNVQPLEVKLRPIGPGIYTEADIKELDRKYSLEELEDLARSYKLPVSGNKKRMIRKLSERGVFREGLQAYTLPKSVRIERHQLSDGFTEISKLGHYYTFMRAYSDPSTPPDITTSLSKKEAYEMLEECLRADVLELEPQTRTTGKNKTTREFYDKYAKMVKDAHISLKGSKTFGTKEELFQKYKKDPHLNNIPLRKFESLYYSLLPSARKFVRSPAENTCLFKHLIIYEVLGMGPEFVER